MATTTRTTECTAPAASLFLALELGSTKWTLGFTTAPAQRPRFRTIAARDLAAVAVGHAHVPQPARGSAR